MASLVTTEENILKPQNRIIVALIILGSFYLADNARYAVYFIFGSNPQTGPDARLFMIYGIQLAISFAVTFLIGMKSRRNTLTELGLREKPLKGLAMAFLITLPMLAGFAVTSPFNHEITGIGILKGSIMAGTVEEILFRGFLFGLLFRWVRAGFFPVIILVSIYFGAGHLYQGYDIGSTLGVFLITAAGSAMFAWLYIEWDGNLWLPIGMHILMNLYWDLFDIDASTALGGWMPNIFRFIVVGLAIFLTIREIRKRGSLLKGKTFRLLY